MTLARHSGRFCPFFGWASVVHLVVVVIRAMGSAVASSCAQVVHQTTAFDVLCEAASRSSSFQLELVVAFLCERHCLMMAWRLVPPFGTYAAASWCFFCNVAAAPLYVGRLAVVPTI